EQEEMYRVFNCGIGMVIVVSAEEEAAITQTLKDQGETVYALGEIIAQQEGQPQTVVV
ncbi:MAG: AIR synthase-related protein, partial [Pelistega sp.]|nr:AIR synthase-related protein [Pelistega sp.]